jgi:hypothetical protein
MALGGNALAMAETLAGFSAAIAAGTPWRLDKKRELTANEIADAARSVAPILTTRFVFIAYLHLRSSEISMFQCCYSFVIP